MQKRADLGRDSHRFIPVLQRPHAGIPQQPQPGLRYRREGFIAGKSVIARAKKGKIIVGSPFEERDGFGDLIARQRRRLCLQFGDRLAHAREHWLPVLNAETNLGEDVVECMHNIGALR